MISIKDVSTAAAVVVKAKGSVSPHRKLFDKRSVNDVHLSAREAIKTQKFISLKP